MNIAYNYIDNAVKLNNIWGLVKQFLLLTLIRKQSLSQDLETGCPKLTILKLLGVSHIFQGRSPYTHITTTNMYLLIEIRHNILIQCHKNCSDVNEIPIMCLELTLRNFSLKKLDVLRGDFWRFGCPNDTQTPCYQSSNRSWIT